jgi:hypothetical protein
MNLSSLTQQEGAALLSVTARTLRDWADAPRNADGSYNGPQLVRYYVAKLTTGGEFDNQRERLAAAQADKVEMENALRRGALVDVSTVSRFWSEVLANCRTRLLGMGSKLGPQLVNIADAAVIATAIRTEARAALTELATYEPDAGTVDTVGEGPTDAAAPAGINGQSVGGHGAASKQRGKRRTGAMEN